MSMFDHLFGGTYNNKTVLVTGHTGFKGSWLSLWLQQMGAKVIGYALSPPTEPNHFDLLQLDITNNIGDILSLQNLMEVIKKYRPEIVFHLAAQPIVRESYRNPIETFETNVIGSLNVYQACRDSNSVKAIVSITTDKVYQNREWIWGYRENDPLGGFDPYSASKTCVEIVSESFRNSFFNPKKYKIEHHTLLCTARAGNVIGGGDWATDRLIPDIMKASKKNEPAIIRNPNSVRPWQHVLEPLAGYLMLGEKLLQGRVDFAEAWNFGPNDDDVFSVQEILNRTQTYWNEIKYKVRKNPNELHETGMLKLDWTKARSKLQWRPIWDMNKTIEKVANWYKDYYNKNIINSLQDLEMYSTDAYKKNVTWIR